MTRLGAVVLLGLFWGGTIVAEVSAPFHRGVNLTGWFQSPSVNDLPFSKFGPEDHAQLHQLGVDVVRLPVNFVGYGEGDRLDPKLLQFLDRAVDGLLAAGFTVVLDNHSDPLDLRIRFGLEAYLTGLWTQLAEHYRDRSPTLLYEIQNEPHEIAPTEWDGIQHRVLAALRRIDRTRTVVVTGADWGSAPALLKLSAYDDPRLIYTFHCYDPFRFTHQGAAWAGQAGLSGVRFPLPGDEAALARTLDAVVAFEKSRGVPVWCGEFGVYNLNADPIDRVEWYRTFRGLLDERSLPWTMWDYRGSFGLFTKDSAEVFDQDLNLPLVEALGFHPVAQRPPGPVVETSGFFLYRDEWQPGTRQAGNSRGLVDAHDERSPFAGSASLRASGLERYASVAWDFAPHKNLTALAPHGRLLLWMRSSAIQFSVDLRFVDAPGPGKDGLPWRMSFTVDQGLVPGDGAWHLVELPLASFLDAGAWDGTWHNPRLGAFGWDRVARFEIVAERGSLAGVDLGFDEIQVR